MFAPVTTNFRVATPITDVNVHIWTNGHDICSAARSANAGEQRVFGAWTELALASVEWGARHDRDAVHRAIGKHMLSMPSSMRRMLSLGLYLFELAPLLTGQSWRRYLSLPLAKRRTVNAQLEHSRFSQLAMLHDGIATICVLAIAGQPQTLALVGIDREELVAASVRARAAQARS